MTRQFRWRTWAVFGGDLLEQTFDTPVQAGQWRHENFPEPDDAPLTLVAVVGDSVERVTPSEMAEAHWAWLHDGATA